MLKNITARLPQIEVLSFSGLLIDFCHKLGVNAILRGLRDSLDFEGEIKVAQGLRVLDPRVETLFMGCDPRYSYLSSSMAREVAAGGGDISAFVPESVIPEIMRKYHS